MARIFFSFLPWIVFFALFGESSLSREIASVAALGIHVLFNYKNIRRLFVLDIGTTLFFVVFVANLFFIENQSLINNGYFISNVALAVIAWVSLAIKKPFTLQYARLVVAKEIGSSHLFLFVNYIITAIWALLLSAMLVPNIIEFYHHLPYETEVNVAVGIILMVIGAWVSIKLPDKIAYKMMEKHFNVDIKTIYAEQKGEPLDLALFNSDKIDVQANNHCQVIIIGAGPVGLTTALLLQSYGVSTLVVEKHPGVSVHPKARAISARSMELFRKLGLQSEIEQFNLPEKQRWFGWFKTLSGELYARIDVRDEYQAISPCEPSTADQPHLEKVLLDAYLTRGGEVLFKHELVNLAQNETIAQATISNRENGQKQVLQAQYIVAADGAHSFVRSQLGIPMIGPDSISVNFSVYCEIDLAEILPEERRFGIAYFARKDRPVPMMIAMDGKNKWVFIFPSGGASEETLKDLYTDEYIYQQIHELIGSEKPEITIISKQVWSLGSQVANQFVAGRTILAGDSIHRFSPTGGMGMNTGLQDADNLAWKLSFILQNKAAPALLATYSVERLPSVLNNLAWSLKNLYRIINIQRQIDLAKIESSEFEVLMQSQSQHLNKSGLDLGLIYQSECVAKTKEPTPLIADDHYVANTYVGARLPHVVLISEGRNISSLDLVSTEFLLLCDCGSEEFISSLSFETLPTNIVVLGKNGISEVHNKQFKQLLGIEFYGALWVRPDGHIAWKGNLSVHEDVNQLQVLIQRYIPKSHDC